MDERTPKSSLTPKFSEAISWALENNLLKGTFVNF